MVTALDELVRRVMKAEEDAFYAAIARADAAGCGVKITRTQTVYDFDADPSTATSTLTIEVCPDVPAGEIHAVRKP